MLLGPDDKVLFIGDSITDAGRAQPVGEGNGLGNGYVSLIDAHLAVGYARLRTRVVNVGTSGHTVRDLATRWDRDVMQQQPDWVSVMIGTNDVWRQFDAPRILEAQVHLPEYRSTLRALVERTVPKVQGMVLMTPINLEPNRSDPMRAQMDAYGAEVRAIADEFKTAFVDTQAAMDALLAHFYPAALAWDRVHPNLTASLALAQAWMEVVTAA